MELHTFSIGLRSGLEAASSTNYVLFLKITLDPMTSTLWVVVLLKTVTSCIVSLDIRD